MSLALVKRIPGAVIDVSRITPGDGVIVCRFWHGSHTSDTAGFLPEINIILVCQRRTIKTAP